jgi:hypothetical protein
VVAPNPFLAVHSSLIVFFLLLSAGTCHQKYKLAALSARRPLELTAVFESKTSKHYIYLMAKCYKLKPSYFFINNFGSQLMHGFPRAIQDAPPRPEHCSVSVLVRKGFLGYSSR